MQITKKRLKQIIKEELIRLSELETTAGAPLIEKIQQIEEIMSDLTPEQRAAVFTTLASPQK